MRVRRPNRFCAVVPNDAMRDKSISIEARGVLALMMTYSDDWQFFRSHIMDVAAIGRDKFQRIMGELVEAGYIELQRVRSEGGKVSGTTYVIHDDPKASTDNLKTRSSVTEGLNNRQPGKPTAGFSGPIRRTEDKKNNREEEQDSSDDLFSGQAEKRETRIDEQFETWWKAMPKREGSNPKKPCRAKFKTALRSVSFDDLMAATKAYAKTRLNEDPRFTPMAQTWLHQERWTEFLPQGRKPDGGYDPDRPFDNLPPDVAREINKMDEYWDRVEAARAWWKRQINLQSAE